MAQTLPHYPGSQRCFTCYYQYIYSSSPVGYVFQVSASDNSKPSLPINVYILADSLTIENNKSYDLQNQAKGNIYGSYGIFTNGLLDDYFTYYPSSGELIITKFDQINRFWEILVHCCEYNRGYGKSLPTVDLI